MLPVERERSPPEMETAPNGSCQKIGTCSLTRQFQRVSLFETFFRIRLAYAFEDGDN